MNKATIKLLQQLKIVMKSRDFDKFDDTYLSYEIDRAIAEINRCRNFTPTDTSLYDKKYEYLIIPMCLSAIAKIGAEGETIHIENGISRTYGSDNDYPKSLTSQIIPLIKC